MTVERAPGTLAHVLAILADPSDVTRSELKNCPLAREEITAAIKDFLTAGGAETLLVDGKPVVQLGVYPQSPGVLGTWFVASEAFMATGAQGVLFSRHYMRELAARHPGAAFESLSWSTHPDTVRWFKIMGFEFVRNHGKGRIFRHFGASEARRDKAA